MLTHREAVELLQREVKALGAARLSPAELSLADNEHYLYDIASNDERARSVARELLQRLAPEREAAAKRRAKVVARDSTLPADEYRREWAIVKSILTANAVRGEGEIDRDGVGWPERDGDFHELAFAVQKFRSTHLGGSPIPVEQISAWVAEHRGEIEGTETEMASWGTLYVPTVNPTGGRDGTPWRYQKGVRVRPGGVLDDLRLLAGGDHGLAALCRWSAVGAVAFVLADETPMVITESARSEWAANGRRIIIEVDADYTAEEVAALYLKACGRAGGSKRSKPLTPKWLKVTRWAISKPKAGPAAMLKAAEASGEFVAGKKFLFGNMEAKEFGRRIEQTKARILYGRSG